VSATSHDGDTRLASRAVGGTLWNLLTFALTKGSLLLTTVVLARILAPRDFGLLALGLLVITYLDVLGDAGVGAAVIYRQERGPKDASTAVVIATGTALVLAATTFVGAPGLALLFDEPRLADIVRVLCVAFLVNQLAVVHRRKLEKDLLFRRRMVPEVVAAVVKGGSAIALALGGVGVWSLVWGQLLGAATSTVLLWVVSTWRFRLAFDRQAAREMLRFGVPVTLLGLLAAAIRTSDVVIIGRYLSGRRARPLRDRLPAARAAAAAAVLPDEPGALPCVRARSRRRGSAAGRLPQHASAGGHRHDADRSRARSRCARGGSAVLRRPVGAVHRRGAGARGVRAGVHAGLQRR
jgi:O-antigen/teichoic acid export membrane protein